MKRIKLLSYIMTLLIFGLFLTPNSYAEKYPSLAFIVKGKVIDWKTKNHITGATVIAFLNGAVYSVNNGYWKQYDYPNFSKSDNSGEFSARTQLYRWSEKDKPTQIEIIAFCEGYRTEKFIIREVNFTMPDENNDWGIIENVLIEMFKSEE